MILLSSGPRTGKTVWARRWVAESLAHRRRQPRENNGRVHVVNDEAQAKVLYETGISVAFETNLPIEQLSEGLRRRVTRVNPHLKEPGFVAP